MPANEIVTQSAHIESLLRAGWVSPLVALQAAGCMRLAARVHDLRRAGVNVLSRWREHGGARFCEYRIDRRKAARPA